MTQWLVVQTIENIDEENEKKKTEEETRTISLVQMIEFNKLSN